MSNDVIIEAWNTVLFDKFSRFKYLFVEGYAAISREILSRDSFAAGANVLDIGCGFGDCTVEIARSVGPEGLAIGVDCAENFIRASRDAAVEDEAANADFFVADVQVDDLAGPYDAAFSRFGTMFFTNSNGSYRGFTNIENRANGATFDPNSPDFAVTGTATVAAGRSGLACRLLDRRCRHRPLPPRWLPRPSPRVARR